MDSNIQRALALFCTLDKDGDFRLDLEDLRKVLLDYYPPSSITSATPFSSLSSVPDGKLDFVEFFDFLQEKGLFSAARNRTLILRLILKMTDGDPCVDCAKLAAKMQKAGYPVTADEIALVFSLLLGEPVRNVSADDILSLFLNIQT